MSKAAVENSRQLTAAQGWLILGGLAVFLAGLTFGVVYTYLVDHETLPRLREYHQEAFVAAAERDFDRAREEMAVAEQMNYQYVRAIDVHTHLLKMASVAILVGLIFPLILLGERARYLLAVVFFGSGVVFPLGVFLQIGLQSPVPQAIAAGGALLAIVSFAFLHRGLLRGVRDNA